MKNSPKTNGLQARFCGKCRRVFTKTPRCPKSLRNYRPKIERNMYGQPPIGSDTSGTAPSRMNNKEHLSH